MKGESLKSKEYNTSFVNGLVHHYYMDRLAFGALIKHIFKTDLKKDKSLCVKHFISVHMQTLTLQYSP